jgi:2,3-bisphosphoglycerate-independent phosphoglycerate mutase
MLKIDSLLQPNDNKIVLVILHGLGGIQSGPNLLTELQQAHTPNMDALARKSTCGLLDSVQPGITPEEKSALNALFGLETTASDNEMAFTEQLKLKALALCSESRHVELFHKYKFYTRGPFESMSEIGQVFDQEYSHYDFHLISWQVCDEQTKPDQYYEKIKEIEKFDQLVPVIMANKPYVLCITGDRSIPTATGKPSMHPNPVMIHAKSCRYDGVQSFDEIACMHGGLGRVLSANLLPLLLGHAGRLRNV